MCNFLKKERILLYSNFIHHKLFNKKNNPILKKERLLIWLLNQDYNIFFL